MSDLTEWIKKSIELDLIYDEEQHNVKLINEEIQDLSSASKPEDVYNEFIKLKRIRIRNGLALEDSQLQCAKLAVQFHYNDGRGRMNNIHNGIKEVLNTAVSERKSKLDHLESATWHCAAVLDYLSKKYTIGRNIREWATLRALYLTELCACAHPELSLAAAYELLEAEWLNNVKYSDVFRYTGHHMVATGMRHKTRHLDVTNRLGIILPDIREYCDNNKIFGDLLWRLIFFRASLTLAGALSDLQRYAECRYYLEWALDNVSHLSDDNARIYWKKNIEFHLILAEVDSGQREKKDSISEAKHLSQPRRKQPRLKALWYDVQCAVQENTNWLKSELFNLGWHAAEPSQMAQRLQGMIRESTNLLNSKHSKRIVSLVTKLLEYVKKLIIEFINVEEEYKSFEFLLYEFNEETISELENLQDRDLKRLWNLAKYLSKLLVKLNLLVEKLPDNLTQQYLQQWITILKKNLKIAGYKETFAKVCSNVEILDILSHQLEPREKLCPNSPNGKIGINDCIHEFKYGCATAFVQDRPVTASCAHCLYNSEGGCNSILFNEMSTTAGWLSWKFYWETMTDQDNRLSRYLINRTGLNRQYVQGETYRKSRDFEFVSLQRWNSFSPSLGSRAALTVGGGYFVRVRVGFDDNDPYLGIAIDPGYNFLENLFNEGFTVSDIDLIAITHAHPDHTENLTNLLTLIYERNSRYSKQQSLDGLAIDHKPILVTTEGVFDHFQKQLESHKRNIRDIVVITTSEFNKPGIASSKTIYLWKEKDHKENLRWCLGEDRKRRNMMVKLQGAPAWHNDMTGYDSIGLIITYIRKASEYHLGILGDTRYHSEIAGRYGKCHVLVAHIGSLVDLKEDPFNEENPENTQKTLQQVFSKENHLYLPGFAKLVCDMKDNALRDYQQLFVLSEFGEELRGGLRADIVRRICTMHSACRELIPLIKSNGKSVQNETVPLEIIPADVGLRIDLMERKILCCVCHHFIESRLIEPITILPDVEAIAYVCRDCMIARHDELPKLLEEWCRTARPLIENRREISAATQIQMLGNS